VFAEGIVGRLRDLHGLLGKSIEQLAALEGPRYRVGL